MSNIQFVAIEMPNGNVAVMQFLTEYRAPVEGEERLVKREATDEAIEQELQRSGFAGRKRWQRIDQADIPTDRTFRNAWKLDGETVGIDMAKAREIHKTRIREARAPMLASLDVEYQRADERGEADKKRHIADRKQALRDVTADPRLAAAKTAEELAAIWPEVLGPRP
jgi:hypothetical protein